MTKSIDLRQKICKATIEYYEVNSVENVETFVKSMFDGLEGDWIIGAKITVEEIELDEEKPKRRIMA